MDEQPVFRASKKRRTNRQAFKHDDQDDDITDQRFQEESATTLAEINPDHSSDGGLAETSTALMGIKHRKQRIRQGIQFVTNSPISQVNNETASMALTKVEAPEIDPLKDMTSRFTSGTGQVTDVDKHMMAYVDSQIAKRHQSTALSHPPHRRHRSRSSDNHSDVSSLESDDDEEGSGVQDTTGIASHDLAPVTGAHVSQHNPMHLTEVNLPVEQPRQSKPAPRQRKPRLGRDGKPFRPRPKKRRNSNDVNRDLLVEQILAENRLDHPTTTISGSGPHVPASGTSSAQMQKAGMNVDADEKLAAEFRQQFMDAVAERQARFGAQSSSSATGKRGAAGGTGTGAGAGSEVPSGPKMGGGRSARARMQAQLQMEKDKEREKSQSGR